MHIEIHNHTQTHTDTYTYARAHTHSNTHTNKEYCCYIRSGAFAERLELLDKIQRRICHMIGHDLASSLQSLSHRRAVDSFCLFYEYFHGNCSKELISQFPRCMNLSNPLDRDLSPTLSLTKRLNVIVSSTRTASSLALPVCVTPFPLFASLIIINNTNIQV